MAKYNDAVDAVLTELERFAIKSEIVHRGKHLEIVWQYPNGMKRSRFVSATPSDHRAPLNERAAVRRQLRVDKDILPSATIIQFQKAMALPMVKNADRYAELEKHFYALLDLFSDVQQDVVTANEHIQALEAKLASVQVVSTLQFGVTQTAPVVADVVKKKRTRGRDGQLAALLTPQYQHRDIIAQRLGVPIKVVSTYLNRALNKGVAEKGQRGFWRLKPGA